MLSPALQLPGRVLGGDGDAAIFAVLFDARDAPYFFHDAGKHEDLDERPDIINPPRRRAISLFIGIAQIPLDREVFSKTMQLEMLNLQCFT